MIAEAFGYCWTRKSTGEFYIGVHKGQLDDGYVGSGTVFKKKYASNPSDWERTIEFRGSMDECLSWERDMVSAELTYTGLCLNIAVGGGNSNYGKPLSDTHKKRLSESASGNPNRMGSKSGGAAKIVLVHPDGTEEYHHGTFQSRCDELGATLWSLNACSERLEKPTQRFQSLLFKY